jgi:hypothetical protein
MEIDRDESLFQVSETVRVSGEEFLGVGGTGEGVLGDDWNQCRRDSRFLRGRGLATADAVREEYQTGVYGQGIAGELVDVPWSRGEKGMALMRRRPKHLTGNAHHDAACVSIYGRDRGERERVSVWQPNL